MKFPLRWKKQGFIALVFGLVFLLSFEDVALPWLNDLMRVDLGIKKEKKVSTVKNIHQHSVQSIQGSALPNFTLNLSADTGYVSLFSYNVGILKVQVSDSANTQLQWYKNSTNSTTGAVAIPGATSHTLVPANHTLGTTFYYAEARNADGTTQSIIKPITVRGVQANAVTISQKSASIDIGGSSLFLVGTVGPNGASNTNVYFSCSDTTGAGLVLNQFDPSNVRVIARRVGMYTITVRSESQIEYFLQDLILDANTNHPRAAKAFLWVDRYPDGSLSYGLEVRTYNGNLRTTVQKFSNISSIEELKLRAQASAISLSDAQISEAQLAAPQAFEDRMQLTVRQPAVAPSFISNLGTSVKVFHFNFSDSVFVRTGGYPAPTYQWFYSLGHLGTPFWIEIPGETSHSFKPGIFFNGKPNLTQDSVFVGRVRVVATNATTSISSVVQPIVVFYKPPSITQNLSSDTLDVTPGTPVNLSFTATVHYPNIGAKPGYTYQWYKNTTASTQGSTEIVSARGQTSYQAPTDVLGTTYYYAVLGYPSNPPANVYAGAVNYTNITPVLVANPGIRSLSMQAPNRLAEGGTGQVQAIPQPNLNGIRYRYWLQGEHFNGQTAAGAQYTVVKKYPDGGALEYFVETRAANGRVSQVEGPYQRLAFKSAWPALSTDAVMQSLDSSSNAANMGSSGHLKALAKGKVKIKLQNVSTGEALITAFFSDGIIKDIYLRAYRNVYNTNRFAYQLVTKQNSNQQVIYEGNLLSNEEVAKSTVLALGFVLKDSVIQVAQEMAPLDFIATKDLEITPQPAQSGLSLNHTSVVMNVGEQLSLEASPIPSDALLNHVLWTSTNPSTISVNQLGLVQALGNGTALIRVINGAVAAPFYRLSNTGEPFSVIAMVIKNADQSFSYRYIEYTDLGKRYLGQVHGNRADFEASIQNNFGTTISSATLDALEAKAAELNLINKTSHHFYTNADLFQAFLDITKNNDYSFSYKIREVFFDGRVVQGCSRPIPSGCEYSLTGRAQAISSIQNSYAVSSFNAAIMDSLEAVAAWGGPFTKTAEFISRNGSERPLQQLRFASDSLVIRLNESLDLNTQLIFNPINASNKAVTWQSSNAQILSINQDGLATGRLSGKALIYVNSVEGNFTDTLKVYVLSDSDGDGVPDDVELAQGSDPLNGCQFNPNLRVQGFSEAWNKGDCDGDGIINYMENNASNTIIDTDHDEIPNFLDPDSDDDGLMDQEEQNQDSDGDGWANYQDLDADNDGISDRMEGLKDIDRDGIPNYLDLDADGDGLLDAWENLYVFDANKDGNYNGQVDINGVFIDNNKNGLLDDLEGYIPTDTDGDGTPDYLDLDSDEDCIPDGIDGGDDFDADHRPQWRDADSDNDGISDRLEAGNCTKPIDTDGDGQPDYLDLDSDNDGLIDAFELGKDANHPLDSDGDGLADFRDDDADNDGLSDTYEKGNGALPIDSDGDGLPDYLDADSDGDGLTDAYEKGPNANQPLDTDLDGRPNHLDTDADNDGIPDGLEAGLDLEHPADADADGMPNHLDLDADADGIPDEVERGQDGNSPRNSDKDVLPDYLDTDSDDDTILDELEKGPNGNQPLDTDADGLPNYRDLDSDADQIPDKVEKVNAGMDPIDTDKDGLPDYLDKDSDADRISDLLEAGGNPNIPQDTDKDGLPNYRDADSDGDGVSDAIEVGINPNSPKDSDGDGAADYLDTDADGNGILDAIEAGGNPNAPLDTDKDGLYDFLDSDDDNDQLSDVLENDLLFGNLQDCDGDGIINRLDADPCSVSLPQGFSPNGDGINDAFVIPGVGSLPKNTLSVYHVAGYLVYQKENYKNEWKGENNQNTGGTTTDGILNEGVYYYVFEVEGREAIRSYVYINRRK